MNAGIDYGLGQTNIDTETGIRYGVISLHSLDSWIYEELEPEYGDACCPSCGTETRDSDEFEDPKSEFRNPKFKEQYCDVCEEYFWSEECYPDSPHSHTLDKNGYSAETDMDCINLFVYKSLYFTRAKYCSPCVPGAGDLNSPCSDGAKAYCLGHDYFEGDKAPYPVYSVETGEEVLPK